MSRSPGGGSRTYRLPLELAAQPEGGYTVTSPALPGLVTEGETVEESLEHAWEALLCLLDGYEELGRPLPLGLPAKPDRATIHFDYLVVAA
jgi:antitoxin HicB